MDKRETTLNSKRESPDRDYDRSFMEASVKQRSRDAISTDGSHYSLAFPLHSSS